MARRKSLAQREPSGKVQREPQLPPSSEIRRLRDAALSGMRDPTWGTEIGRLYLVGKITASMYAAGKKWGEQSTQYSQALCSPCPDPRAINFDMGGGSPPDPDSYEGRKEARRHERAVTSFIDAHVALKASGTASERIVRLLCERNQMLGGHADLLALIRGLQALCSYWGLTGSGKSVSDRQS